MNSLFLIVICKIVLDIFRNRLRIFVLLPILTDKYKKIPMTESVPHWYLKSKFIFGQIRVKQLNLPIFPIENEFNFIGFFSLVGFWISACSNLGNTKVTKDKTRKMKTNLSFPRVNSKSTKIFESDYYVVLFQGHTKALFNVYRDYSLDLVFAPWPCRNIWME